MKILMTSMILSFGMGGAHAYAQSVQMQSFDSNQKTSFVLGDDGARKATRKPVVIKAERATQEDLAKDFAAILPESQEAQNAAPVDRQTPKPGIKIPKWMQGPSKGQGAGGYRFFSRPVVGQWDAYQPVSYPNGCSDDVYRPKHLKLEVEARRARYYSLMVSIACETGVPVKLFDALLTQESGYNPYALSPKGAVGMSQLMPDTARAFGVTNSWDIAENMRGGARVLKAHLNEFGRYDLALAAYNAGPNRVRKNLTVPRISETMAYVGSILSDVRRQFQASFASR